MLAAFARRAEAADFPERGGAVADAHFATPSRYHHRAAVSRTEATKVIVAAVLLVRTSNAAPVSMTRWRMPEKRCWKNAQVRPISTIFPGMLAATFVKLAYVSVPPASAVSHQARTARPTIARPPPVMRWTIEAVMPGPHRQTVRWGERGRGCGVAMGRPLKARSSERQV